MKVQNNEAVICGKYIAVPFKYGTDRMVCFFIPTDFIEGAVGEYNLSPDNLFGVDITAVLKHMKDPSEG